MTMRARGEDILKGSSCLYQKGCQPKKLAAEKARMHLDSFSTRSLEMEGGVEVGRGIYSGSGWLTE